MAKRTSNDWAERINSFLRQASLQQLDAFGNGSLSLFIASVGV
jgi:hypothetical protein